jgi:hypothetical protein
MTLWGASSCSFYTYGIGSVDALLEPKFATFAARMSLRNKWQV